MSILQVNEIKSTTSGGNCIVKATNSLSNRRLNINGAMTVAQRGTSASLTGNNNSQDAYRVVDRYLMGCRSDAVWTYSQESDGPPGFAKSFKALCTTADSSVAANVYEQFVHTFEGQDVQLLKQGTSDAVSVTISFWVKSNKTGTYILEIRDLDNNRHNSKSYTISSSATWEKKTITYSGDTTGALDNDNAASFRVYWWLAAGSDKSSGTLATSWAATNEANRAVGQVQLTDTANNYWQITGVQIEVGDTATDFEHRSYGEELTRCQRYFLRIEKDADTAYTALSTSCWNRATNNTRCYFAHQVPMRALPTFAIDTVGNTRIDSSSSSHVFAGNDPNSTTLQTNNCSKFMTVVDFGSADTNIGIGHGAQLRADGAVKLDFSAEL